MEALGSYPISFGSGRVPTTSDGDESKRLPNRRRSFQAAGDWLRRRSTAAKIGLAVAAAVAAMFVLKHTVTNHNYLFIASEIIHAAGLLILAYKLTTHKTCSGMSSKSQELTALFLLVRLIFGSIMEVDVYTFLDSINFIATVWVIYMIRSKLKNTYNKALDNFHLYYVVVPSMVLSLFIFPHVHYNPMVRVLWAFGVYVESFSMLPQLLMMQNAKMIEPFTAHYVFAMGISRFLAFAYWVIQVYETRGRYLLLVGHGYFWFMAAFIAEMIQSFILSDFCYYYAKSVMQGKLRMPV
ncbi:ER lumen protein-retaining receptor 3-like isoform X1 [Cucurbita maxima]|uniref:ER lumen protein-retaining receptor 3-like isoform X1 n=1 Tax=Cucurbita maxima TaxID=3661 RepID=A0A6J1K4X7_CUCMA|nr:ER lumen protein-retaining receptor 3-like isoform X1 [Cucurbita maxima]XP_022995796.1 ER lumen protein-retaining receptor 3-like isoform X1 [Cucurbita maxima]